MTISQSTGSDSSRRGRRRARGLKVSPPGPRVAPASPSLATPSEPSGAVVPSAERSAPAFAHASEAEMARILDYYRIAWEYEPHTFPILWNLEGAVVESFSPDFWLPDLELYLEMTTLRQKLVRKKNRKLRRIRELYPDLRVKLFYARDFRALMLKFGRLALADALSGTSGQVVHEPLAASVLAGPLGADDIPPTTDVGGPA